MNRWALLGLGFGLAAIALTPAQAQVVVGGDWRPQVQVDPGVLDRLGPEPTLPDLLLGRHPMAPAGTSVKLHRPHARAKIAAAPSAESNKPAKKAAAKPMKMAEAERAAPPSQPPATKTLVSPLEPAPRPAKPLANADMPQTAPPKPAVMTPPPVKPGESAQAAAAPTPPPASAAAPAPAQAAAPPAPAAQAPAPTPPPQQQALLTPPPVATTEATGALSLPFAKDTATISDDARNALTALAKRANADPSIQLQVLAYASGDEDNSSKARRLSLTRALAVRSFLIDQGVHSTRIEVRALGNRVPEGPADRVDLVEEKR